MMDAEQQLRARYKGRFGSAGCAEGKATNMERLNARSEQRGKVVRLYPAPSPSKDAPVIKSMPPANHISEETARQILASQIEQVAGSVGNSERGLLVIFCVGIAVLLTIAYAWQ